MEIGQSSRGRRSWVWWVGGVFLLLAVAAGVVVEYVVHHAEPIVRRRVIASFEQRFNSPVELDALHISVFKGLQVTGEGLRILRIAGPERPDAQEKSMGGAGGAAPMLSVKSFEFHAGVRELFEPTMRVAVVRVSGLDLNIPPKGERGQLLHHDTAKKQPKFSIVLDEIVVSNMTLTVETNKPGKMPLVFPIRNVTLHDVGRDKAFPFEAWLVNAKPVGDIHSTGRFGPWVDDEPRDTPISGGYSFTHADLGPIKGVAGILSSTGSYAGTLGEIGVVGTTDTPDFSLDTAVHAVHLKTAFDATVDGTSGDTILNHVHATFLNTELEASGKIVRAGGRHDTREGVTDVSGHFIDIAVTSDHARMEDILELAAKTKPAVMRGATTLRARVQIPPGKVSVSKKVRVQGTFAIRDAMFNNAKWQDTVDKLSVRASGKLKETESAPADRVASEMGGTFALADGVVAIPKLHYQMPGAEVNLAGKYSLDGKAMDFSGTVKTAATASQMLKGWKSLVAKPFDPLLRKDGAGLEVPITVHGTEDAPKLGLDMGKLGAEIFSRHKKEPAAEGHD
ncbi:MAG TPA: hypothetical protein VGU46_04010 [Acidobacteriaceae bacterium]|nr:hypothetical protein [Acidobacteriaceae bacterium]